MTREGDGCTRCMRRNISTLAVFIWWSMADTRLWCRVFFVISSQIVLSQIRKVAANILWHSVRH